MGWRFVICPLTLAALVGGCAGGLKLTPIETAYRKPSNVAVYFAVDTKDGEPVADLLSSDFKIYEDGALVSVDESRQTIVNPELAAAHYTMLLVDMSASVTESDQVAQIVAAASQFVTSVETQQRVGVYAFDGSKEIHEISPFTTSDGKASQGVGKLATFTTKDPSTNLHGAIVQAVRTLDKALEQSTVPLRFGTLVVFTDGTDRASRVPFQEMIDAVQAADYSVFAIGVGNEIDDNTLSRIGRSGYIRVEDATALAAAFNQISERIVQETRRFYLLSYCSPARAGKHTVTVEAHAHDTKGELQYEFDATNFSPDCDAQRPPPFDTTGKSASSRKKLGALDHEVGVEIEVDKKDKKAKK